MTKNPNIGRQKITMAKIAKKNNLQVTFSKRRAGLFKKASELCTLCGVDVAIIIFSPAKKVFSFGHPRVESIIDRFLSSRNLLFRNSTTSRLVEAHRNANIHELNIQLTQLLEHLEIEKRRGEAVDKIRKASQKNQCWWQAPINELGLDELEQLRIALEELKKNVAKQANKALVESANNQWQFLAVNGIGRHVNPFENKFNETNLHCSVTDHQAYGFDSYKIKKASKGTLVCGPHTP
ncbi:agamous-like MADS-box protein AGL62 [Durio zibethinus]|uniref:Agamous-like MADS-box protein AGL62 n=1 Tax=Durio zibethinus TaxID=66656 RepID=A0A6P6ACE4_DURZI|nr:agamous-like MADS-box protein AGL62 [Durio zibethinus]